MYHIHLQKAFIIDMLKTKDDDMSCVILTPDMGLLRVNVIGIRKAKSKLRYAIQKTNHTEFALIQGNAGWQSTNAILLDTQIISYKILEALDRLGQVIMRIVPYGDITEAYTTYKTLKEILQEEEYDTKTLEAFLYIAVLNILDTVGYGITYTVGQKTDTSFPFSEGTLQFILKNQIMITKDITKALNNSQL